MSEPTFWTYGRTVSLGDFAGVSFRAGFLGGDSEDEVFVCYLSREQDFPAFLEPVFKRYFFGKTICVKCLCPMTELRFRALREFNGRRTAQNSYITCVCEHPVWRIRPDLLRMAEISMGRPIVSSRRRQRMKAAQGKYSS